MKLLTQHSQKDFFEGCRDCLPLMIGGIPVGLTCGLMSAIVGFNPLEVLFMSALVFSGVSQFVVITMLQAGSATLGLLMLNVLLVNLHNVLLLASLAPYLIKLPKFFRHFLCFSMSDGTYALTMNRVQQYGYSADYQLGASMIQYLSWITSNLLGTFAGRYIPNPLSWGLDFTLTAVFIAILIPKLRDQTVLSVSIVAAITAVLAATYLGGKWYIILACITATLTGVYLEGRRKYEG